MKLGILEWQRRYKVRNMLTWENWSFVIFYQINSQSSLEIEIETSVLTSSPPVATKLPPFSLTENFPRTPEHVSLLSTSWENLYLLLIDSAATNGTALDWLIELAKKYFISQISRRYIFFTKLSRLQYWSHH